MKKVIKISFLFAMLFFECKKSKIIIANPAYSIGAIVFYKPFNNSASRIDFTYTISGKLYENNYANNENGWPVPSSGNYKTGDKYMVQYDNGNLNTAKFLFSYPVNDSADYKNDVILFKTNPPQ